MTENTIWKLERLLEDTKTNHFSLTEKRDIIQAVKKGIKLPLKFNRNIGEFHKQFVCPNCEEKQWITSSGYCYPKRCDNCGQKLDWKAFKEHEENLQKKLAEILMNKE